jgi:hypothetical protein
VAFQFLIDSRAGMLSKQLSERFSKYVVESSPENFLADISSPQFLAKNFPQTPVKLILLSGKQRLYAARITWKFSLA